MNCPTILGASSLWSSGIGWFIGNIREKKTNRQKPKDNYLLQHLWDNAKIHRFMDVESEIR